MFAVLIWEKLIGKILIVIHWHNYTSRPIQMEHGTLSFPMQNSCDLSLYKEQYLIFFQKAYIFQKQLARVHPLLLSNYLLTIFVFQ